MSLFFATTGFINGFSIIVLGMMVLLHNFRKRINQIYFFYCLSVAFWAISYGIWQLSIREETALFWTRMLTLGSNFIPVFWYHWTISLLEIEKQKKEKIILCLGYLLAIVFAFFTFNELYVHHVEKELMFSFWPKPGILYHFYLLFAWGGLIGYSFYLLIKNYYSAQDNLKRGQIMWVLTGGLVGYGGGATNFLLWYGIPVPPYGNILVVLGVASFAYTSIRHRMMDITWVLGKTGVYILSFLSVIAYNLLLLWLNKKLEFSIPYVLGGIILAVTSILFFLYFYRLFEKIAGKYFYYTLYNLQNTLNELVKNINKTVKLEQITKLITSSLSNALQLDKTDIILEDIETKFWRSYNLMGFQEENVLPILSQTDNFLIRYLNKNLKPIIKDEIPFIPEKNGDKEEKKELNILKQTMEREKIAVFFPLFIEEKIIGIIMFGEKISRKPYTVQDINILSVLASQAAVALNNALSHYEIERRRAELEKFYKLTVGRELRMAELKGKIKELEGKIKTPQLN